jgi:hypothetical protein
LMCTGFNWEQENLGRSLNSYSCEACRQGSKYMLVQIQS